MFGKKGEVGRPQGRIDSLIGVGTRIEGSVRFSGGLRVDGEVVGSVEAVEGTDSVLIVSELARIEGAVRVAHLVINGQIVGPVCAAHTLEMQPRARVVGDVSYGSIEMHQGAIIEGRLMHGPSAGEAVAPHDVEELVASSAD